MGSDYRRLEGSILLLTIKLRAQEFTWRERRTPTYVSLCRADIEKLWVALAEREDSFVPDEYVKVADNVWVRLVLVEELPEGIVVVS